MSNASNRSHAWNKRAMRKVTFTLLVCGQPGTGKTTFIETLLGKQNLVREKIWAKQQGSNMELYTTTGELDEEDGSRLALTVIDTTGFGDSIDSTNDIDYVAEYVETRFDEVLAEESRIRRNPKFRDNRVHACLYFIEPTGHGLRELDVAAMKRLGAVVNVIPVLARADQMTTSERLHFKNQVVEDLNFHEIPVYDFGQDIDDLEEESEYVQLLETVKKAQPFAVVSSTEFAEDGHPLYRRKLCHGSIDITNPKFSDFILLRETLLTSFLSDLKDATRDVLYESYRTARLSEPTMSSVNRKGNRSSLLSPEELAEHANRLKEAQLLRENQQLLESENKIAKEIEERKRQLLEREKELKEMEIRLAREREALASPVQQQSLPDSVQTRYLPNGVAARPASTATGDEAFADAKESANGSRPVVDKIDIKAASAVNDVVLDAPKTPRRMDNENASSPSPPPRSPHRPLSFVGATSPLQIKKGGKDDIPPLPPLDSQTAPDLRSQS